MQRPSVVTSMYWPSAWPVDIGSVVDVEDGDRSGVVVDAVDDAVGAASGPLAAGQKSEEGFAYAVGVDGQGLLAELQHGGGDRFGQSVGDGPPSGGQETEVVALRRLVLGAHPPVARRRARSARTVARSTPVSPSLSAARLS